MAEQPADNTSTFIRDFEATLGALDGALTDATRAVSAIRAFVPQISALAQVVVTIESAVTQARQNVDAAAIATPATYADPAPVPTPATALRAVEPEPQIETQEGKKESTSATQCLRLLVTKANGSLDLKTVDNAVNEHPEIVDLALLDYDGRQATLKVWISGVFDWRELQRTLADDLITRIGEGAQVKIEPDEESAAA